MGDYLGYVATFEKGYNSNTEFADRLGQYMSNDDYIKQCNYDADHNTDEYDPVHCAHNQFSDWTEAEYMSILGFVGDEFEAEEAADQVDEI